MYWHWEATARAVRDMKIRGFISAVFIDMFDSGKGREQIALNRDLYALSGSTHRMSTFTFGPHALYTVSRESLEWMRDFSAENDILIHMHLAETENESVFSRNTYGLSPTAFLDSLNILSERYIGCHGCMLDSDGHSYPGEARRPACPCPRIEPQTCGRKDIPAPPRAGRPDTLLLRNRRMCIEQSPGHPGDNEICIIARQILLVRPDDAARPADFRNGHTDGRRYLPAG